MLQGAGTKRLRQACGCERRRDDPLRGAGRPPVPRRGSRRRLRLARRVPHGRKTIWTSCLSVAAGGSPNKRRADRRAQVSSSSRSWCPIAREMGLGAQRSSPGAPARLRLRVRALGRYAVGMPSDDDPTPELTPPPSTPPIAWRVAPIVVAAMMGAGCGDPGEPPAVYDAGISVAPDAGPAIYDAGIQDASRIEGDDAGSVVYDAGITAPSDSGASK